MTIYYDDNTGLEWMKGPDEDMSWNDAKEWVTRRKGWGMPTIKELKGF
jgi:hypothetical protein